MTTPAWDEPRMNIHCPSCGEPFDLGACRCPELVQELRAENERLRHALGDDLATCSVEGCTAFYVSDGSMEPSRGWRQSVGEYPPREYCPEHVKGVE